MEDPMGEETLGEKFWDNIINRAHEIWNLSREELQAVKGDAQWFLEYLAEQTGETEEKIRERLHWDEEQTVRKEA